jgi:glycosyltransferase involved in cell wall biosynthesis
LNVVILPSWYNSERAPARGGFVKDQAQALLRAGHAVSVIVLDRDAQGRLLGVRQSIEDGIPHYRIAVPSPWHRILGFYFPGLLARQVVRILDVVRPDVIHAHAVRPAGVVAQLAASRTGIPWCLTEHSGPLRKFWTSGHGAGHIAQAYSRTGRLFAVSDSLRREMLRYFPAAASHTEVLHNGIDTDRFKPPASPLRRPGAALLFVGGFVEEKGLPYLLDACARLPTRLDWTLSLVGSGRLAQILRDRAASLGIADRLRWIGPVPHADLPQIYSAHDLLVVSSVTETFSLVAAEALACGVPVVATACGGPEEVVGPLSLPLVPPADPDALAEAIAALLDGLPTFDRAQAVQSIRERFSMDALVRKLDRIYATLIREG